MAYWGGNAQVKPEQVRGGYLRAIDPMSGREVWSWKARHPMVSSVLAIAGDLVFAAELTGEFNAYDARDGRLLWQFQTGSGIHSNPVTYSVGGRQYVAVPSGWGGWMKGFAPELYGATAAAHCSSLCVALTLGKRLELFVIPRDGSQPGGPFLFQKSSARDHGTTALSDLPACRRGPDRVQGAAFRASTRRHGAALHQLPLQFGRCRQSRPADAAESAMKRDEGNPSSRRARLVTAFMRPSESAKMWRGAARFR